MKQKNDRGVTLVALTVTVMVIMLITGAMLYNTKNYAQTKNIDGLYSDIDVIKSKVDGYYLKYGELPVLCEYINKASLVELIKSNAEGKNSAINNSSIVNPNDDDIYYVIDLEKLDGITLNNGYNNEDYKTLKTNKKYTQSDVEDNIYIINNKTHQIYFPHGISIENMMYYTNNSVDFDNMEFDATVSGK